MSLDQRRLKLVDTLEYVATCTRTLCHRVEGEKLVNLYSGIGKFHDWLIGIGFVPSQACRVLHEFFFVAVRLRSFDDVPFLLDRKLRHFLIGSNNGSSLAVKNWCHTMFMSRLLRRVLLSATKSESSSALFSTSASVTKVRNPLEEFFEAERNIEDEKPVTYVWLLMAAKKVDALEECLEGEMSQMKEMVEDRISYVEDKVLSVEDKVFDLHAMVKKLLENQIQMEASETKGLVGRTMNSEFLRRENDVEIMEEKGEGGKGVDMGGMNQGVLVGIEKRELMVFMDTFLEWSLLILFSCVPSRFPILRPLGFPAAEPWAVLWLAGVFWAAVPCGVLAPVLWADGLLPSPFLLADVGVTIPSVSFFSQVSKQRLVVGKLLVEDKAWLISAVVDRLAAVPCGVLAPVLWADGLLPSHFLLADVGVQVFKVMVFRDVFTWSSMVDGYWKNGMVLEARQAFEAMPVKNVVSWIAMIQGRGWKASELRLKSWDDLHKLWYVLLKEKNMLMTQRQMLHAQNLRFPNPERIPKVRKSMCRIKHVLTERAIAEPDPRRSADMKRMINAL
ncbi:hypothetical protein M5K25_026399 [Dendrobium thyrsiflorum]|uniref:Large ribosomal subunit protein uL29m n=1 Tax=Dendrobium thyrsiflorum TaxID=117978 RepID=A0ABD0TXH1_DENTH